MFILTISRNGTVKLDQKCYDSSPAQLYSCLYLTYIWNTSTACIRKLRQEYLTYCWHGKLFDMWKTCLFIVIFLFRDIENEMKKSSDYLFNWILTLPDEIFEDSLKLKEPSKIRF